MAFKAKCKNCGNEAPPEQFKLHHQLRMMVCPTCYTGKSKPKESAPESKPAEPPRPAGWDKEDEYLERMSRIKRQQSQSVFNKIEGTDTVKCTCPACKYSFRFNTEKGTPRVCPYCDSEVPKFKVSDLM